MDKRTAREIAVRSEILNNDKINVKIQKKININEFRFSMDKNYWMIDANRKYTRNEIRQMVFEYKDILSQFGNIDFEFLISFEKLDNKNEDNNCFFIKEKRYVFVFITFFLDEKSNKKNQNYFFEVASCQPP